MEIYQQNVFSEIYFGNGRYALNSNPHLMHISRLNTLYCCFFYVLYMYVILGGKITVCCFS